MGTISGIVRKKHFQNKVLPTPHYKPCNQRAFQKVMEKDIES